MSKKKVFLVSIFVAVCFFGVGLLAGLGIKSDPNGKIEMKISQLAKATKPESTKSKIKFVNTKSNSIDSSKEKLDELFEKVNRLSSHLRALTKAHGCGNGRKDPGEECDKGIKNGTFSSSCSDVCTLTLCGDGVKEKDEECDDGNVNEGDGCNKNCKLEICGNGLLDIGEECDHDLTKNGHDRLCTTNCRLEFLL
jgi:cysteine-rich repeat protein